MAKTGKDPYAGYVPYEAHPIEDNPLFDRIDKATLIAWFRCNSCYTCKWRKEVIDKDPEHDIDFCSRMHEKWNIIDMCSYLGYSKEGREKDVTPKYMGAIQDGGNDAISDNQSPR